MRRLGPGHGYIRFEDIRDTVYGDTSLGGLTGYHLILVDTEGPYHKLKQGSLIANGRIGRTFRMLIGPEYTSDSTQRLTIVGKEILSSFRRASTLCCP